MNKPKRGTSTYNEQLGYLKTLFDKKYHFVASIEDFSLNGDVLLINATTNRGRSVPLHISFVGGSAYRLRMFAGESTDNALNKVTEFDTVPMSVEEQEHRLVATASDMQLHIDKHPFKITVYYKGELLTKQHVTDTNVDNMCKVLPIGFVTDDDGKVLSVHETMYMFSSESFYGFGERFVGFDKRGQRFSCWQSDALSTNSSESYKNHPFFVSSRRYGMFFNNFTKIDFDMGYGSGVSYSATVHDDVLDYVVFAEQDYKSILRAYLSQLGEVPRLPKWAFGLWMSRCSYETREEVEQVIATAKQRGHKIDVIHIDNWQRKDRIGSWVWDEERFPDPVGFIKKLHEDGVKISLWNWPYISELSPLFDGFSQRNFFIKDESGAPILFPPMATVDWKVACFDFTNPDMVTWYHEAIKEACFGMVDVIKTDFSDAVPAEAVYHDGTKGVSGHNKIPLLYAKTVYDTLAEIKAEHGGVPMLWGRSGYAGSHTVPAAWAGDSATALNDHACILRGGLSGAISGIPFWGFDMGGFYNTDNEGYECFPSDEEYIRSCMFGFFAPLSRCHGKTMREPWEYTPETEEIFKRYNVIRHRLMPYLYSASVQSAEQYIPLMRPLIMEFEQDLIAPHIDRQYMLGESLLVAPVFDEPTLNVYLPQGVWHELTTGKTLNGGGYITLTPKIDEIPVFVRENSVLPLTSEDDTRMDIVIYIKDSISTTIHGELCSHPFAVELCGEVVKIDTTLPIEGVKIVSDTPIAFASINGKTEELTAHSGGYCYRF